MSRIESESHIEEIRVPTDLEDLNQHKEIHRRLIDERAAGKLRLLEDFEVASELAGRIEEHRTEEVESFELELDEREHQVLSISRRMGGLAIAH